MIVIRKHIYSIALALGCLLISTPGAHADVGTNSSVHVFDSTFKASTGLYESGDAILINHPGEVPLLIDGGTAGNGKKIIEYLKKNNITTIDMLVTHIHGDHIGGLTTILKDNSIKVRKVYGAQPPTYEEIVAKFHEKEASRNSYNLFLDFQNELNKRNLKMTLPQEGVAMNMLGGTLTVYNTNFKLTPDVKAQLNDLSLVVKYKHGEDSFLFCADMTVEVEKQLMNNNKNFKDKLSTVDVSKIAHHGRKGSSGYAFLDLILKNDQKSPTIGVLTAGELTREPYVLAKYKVRNSKIYSTYDNGAVSFTSKGTGSSSSITMKTEKTKKELPLNNAYASYNGDSYYFVDKAITTPTVVKVDFSPDGGFGSKYPTSGSTYFAIDSNYKVLTGWQKIGSNYHYFDSLGKAVSGVQKLTRGLSSNYYYLNADGSCKIGFQTATINGKTAEYYFIKGANNIENKGKLQTNKGFVTLSNDGTYYVNSDGSKFKGASLVVDGKTYKFDTKTGKCLNYSDWVLKNNNYYYYDMTGKPVNGVQQLYRGSSLNYYYLNTDGSCKIGFQTATINGKTAEYYFVKGANTIENKGKLLNKKGFVTLSNDGTYYINSDGSKFKGSSLVVDGKTYKFDTTTGKCLNYNANSVSVSSKFIDA